MLTVSRSHPFAYSLSREAATYSSPPPLFVKVTALPYVNDPFRQSYIPLNSFSCNMRVDITSTGMFFLPLANYLVHKYYSARHLDIAEPDITSCTVITIYHTIQTKLVLCYLHVAVPCDITVQGWHSMTSKR